MQSYDDMVDELLGLEKKSSPEEKKDISSIEPQEKVKEYWMKYCEEVELVDTDCPQEIIDMREAELRKRKFLSVDKVYGKNNQLTHYVYVKTKKSK